MKRFLFSDLYQKVKVIGFDLDGTLYDDFDFISRVYREIVESTGGRPGWREDILDFMLLRWLEKGSSYPFIFRETQEKFGLSSDFAEKALVVYRNYSPCLNLSPRIKFLLHYIKKDGKRLFLVTDGNEQLQQKKIEALKIHDYFELIVLTNDRPKPEPVHKAKIIKEFSCTPNGIVYIGDREIDRRFAENCGFEFVYGKWHVFREDKP